MNRLSIYSVIILFIFSINSCDKNTQKFPYIHVDTYLNISLPSYSALNNIGGWVYISGGSRGIIVYRQTFDMLSAYDRRCTYNVQSPCGNAEIDSTLTFIECACDGSEYQLYDGTLTKGPASYSLQPYRTSFDPVTNVVHIYN